ncbi:uncharacterized protein LOC111829403 [Capsella rubella]|uniref:uncharacterized protein LOC111829403 n=1 Tax=Capsella rubella TaxID=81985 RepID=UPI000CD49E3A|nr:uncharacterized protein LOC111829403 [Capsella rubella]
MDHPVPVIVVSGNWAKKQKYVFNTDDRGCRIVQIDAETTHEKLVKLVLDDYGLHQLSHKPRLCVEFAKLKDRSNSRTKRPRSLASEVEYTYEDARGFDEDEEEDDEFSTRFDVFDDSDGASSDDDNFTIYGEREEKDEDLPAATQNRGHYFGKVESIGNSESLTVEMAKLNLVVGQRYANKDELEKRVKLLAVRDGFDFSVPKSNTTIVNIKCWVEGCLWRVRASQEGDQPGFVVCIYDSMDYWKSYKTLRFARQIDMGTPEGSFGELPSYLYTIRRANPGTITRLQIDECDRFKYVFIAFGASVAGYKGTLLTALAQDGNFQIFPIAFAVVDTENDDSWRWFFTQLKVAIPDERNLAIISDRHKSIGKAIGEVYPLASRGICTYHLYKNILVKFKGKHLFPLVKKAARCFRMADFTEAFNEIEALHPELHGYLERAGVQMWARVHFPGERYNLMTSNIAESMNKALSNCRSLPIGRVTASRLFEVQPIDALRVQVQYGTSLHAVNLDAKRCTCRRFEHEKIPCVHAIAAAEHMGVSRISLADPNYRSNYLVNAYADSISPPDTALSVPEIVTNQPCVPPIVATQPGRPKKSRIKSTVKIALENKRPRKPHACSRCKEVGHNAKTCRK